MKVNERECILEILSQLTMEIHEEMVRQDNRADRRVKAGRDANAADGQATGLEKALKIVESKEKEIRGLRMERGVTVEKATQQLSKELINFIEIMKLLHAGKKVKTKYLCYTGLEIPTIKVTGTNGTTDNFDLDCCESHKFDTYLPEVSIQELESISVVGYGITSKAIKIEYIYANPQMNRLFAHLEDGRDVDYDFNILNIWSAYDGEYESPKMREVTLTFFKNYDDIHRKYYTTETKLVPEEYRVDEVADYIREHVTSYKGMDIIISFKPEDEIGYPCFICWKERKV